MKKKKIYTHNICLLFCGCVLKLSISKQDFLKQSFFKKKKFPYIGSIHFLIKRKNTKSDEVDGALVIISECPKQKVLFLWYDIILILISLKTSYLGKNTLHTQKNLILWIGNIISLHGKLARMAKTIFQNWYLKIHVSWKWELWREI